MFRVPAQASKAMSCVPAASSSALSPASLRAYYSGASPYSNACLAAARVQKDAAAQQNARIKAPFVAAVDRYTALSGKLDSARRPMQ